MRLLPVMSRTWLCRTLSPRRFPRFSNASPRCEFRNGCRKIPLALKIRGKGEQTAHSGVNAFHEKAGRSQGDSGFILLDKVFLPPSSHCRYASIRTLEERIVSLGACWAFSFQPVLPSDWRPVVSR
jgi:hypothetical protein